MRQPTPPVVALTALLALAAGLLALWYVPAPAVPSIALAVIAAVVTIAAGGKLTQVSIPRLACAVAVTYLRATTLTLQTLTAAALHLLGLAEQWLTAALTTPPTIYTTAA